MGPGRLRSSALTRTLMLCRPARTWLRVSAVGAPPHKVRVDSAGSQSGTREATEHRGDAWPAWVVARARAPGSGAEWPPHAAARSRSRAAASSGVAVVARRRRRVVVDRCARPSAVQPAAYSASSCGCKSSRRPCALRLFRPSVVVGTAPVAGRTLRWYKSGSLH